MFGGSSRAVSPAMMRGGDRLRSAAPARAVDPARRPLLGAGGGGHQDAVGEWLGHVAAGRLLAGSRQG